MDRVQLFCGRNPERTPVFTSSVMPSGRSAVKECGVASEMTEGSITGVREKAAPRRSVLTVMG